MQVAATSIVVAQLCGSAAVEIIKDRLRVGNDDRVVNFRRTHLSIMGPKDLVTATG
jgi:hypothetical protein